MILGYHVTDGWPQRRYRVRGKWFPGAEGPSDLFFGLPTYAPGTIVVILPQFNQVSVVRGLVKRTASRWSLSPTRYRFRSVLNGSGDYVKV